jgi:hypothetical protein
MENFNFKKYLAEGKLLNEAPSFNYPQEILDMDTEIEDLKAKLQAAITAKNKTMKHIKLHEEFVNKESVNEGIGTIALGVAGGLLLLKFLKFGIKTVIGAIGVNVKLPKEKLLEILEVTYKRIYSQSSDKAYIISTLLPVKDFLKDEINAGRITTVKQVVEVIEKAAKKQPKTNQ